MVKLGANIVECCFVISLPDLKGHTKLGEYSIFNLVDFKGE